MDRRPRQPGRPARHGLLQGPPGPRRRPEERRRAAPPQADVFAKGDVAQLIATPSAGAANLKTNADLKDKLGYFPIPGKKAGQPCAVFTGGSDLIIPENAHQRGAVHDFIKELTGENWQSELALAMGYVPNKTELASAVASEEATAAMANGAANGHATPNTPQWANVEANNPIKPYMTAVLQGEDPVKAAREASTAITDTLAE
ncbi:extracellular solute-binding protein [Streptomyces tanashiensis]